MRPSYVDSPKLGVLLVVRELGRGAYGAVFEVTQGPNKYALKEQAYLDEREKALMTSFVKKKFINLVNTLDVFYFDNNWYICMEFCDLNLYEKIKKFSTLQSEDFRYTARQIANGVKELHDMNLIHRDLKPENICQFRITDQRGCTQQTYKICDFGLSREQNIMMTQNQGTPYYQTPEQIKSQVYDKSIDIWALGCIFYELMIGKPLFNGRTMIEIHNKIQKTTQEDIYKQIDSLTNLNDKYKDIIRRMIVIIPKDRINIDQVIKQLEPNISVSQERAQKPVTQGKPQITYFPSNSANTVYKQLIQPPTNPYQVPNQKEQIIVKASNQDDYQGITQKLQKVEKPSQEQQVSKPIEASQFNADLKGQIKLIENPQPQNQAKSAIMTKPHSVPLGNLNQPSQIYVNKNDEKIGQLTNSKTGIFASQYQPGQVQEISHSPKIKMNQESPSIQPQEQLMKISQPVSTYKEYNVNQQRIGIDKEHTFQLPVDQVSGGVPNQHLPQDYNSKKILGVYKNQNTFGQQQGPTSLKINDPKLLAPNYFQINQQIIEQNNIKQQQIDLQANQITQQHTQQQVSNRQKNPYPVTINGSGVANQQAIKINKPSQNSPAKALNTESPSRQNRFQEPQTSQANKQTQEIKRGSSAIVYKQSQQPQINPSGQNYNCQPKIPQKRQ